MSPEESLPWHRLAERITRFEESATYLERTVEQLDQHVRHLQNCLDVLAGRVERIERFLERTTNDETE